LPHALKETAMRAATDAKDMLMRETAKADDNVVLGTLDGSMAEPGKGPQPHSSAKRNDWNTVCNGILRRRHCIFAAKQMDVVTEVAQTFCCSEQIPFGSTIQIESLMNEGDLQEAALCCAFFKRVPD
jgi:hypothetical protein